MFTRFDANKSTKGASKLRRDLINSEIANLRDLLPLPQSTRQRLSQLQLMALICVYVRKANYFQQVFKRHDIGLHQTQTTPNIGFSKALSGFLMMLTQNGKLLYISDNAAEYLGHSMEDLLIHGDSVYDIIDKQDHGSIQAELGRSVPQQAAGHHHHPHHHLNHHHATHLDGERRMFLCRMNVSRNARRQMRFGDQKVVLVQGHYLSYLPLCSRNEPVFLATCTPIAMPETRECVVQGATNIFTTIHSMDMKIMHIDKNGEFHLGYTKNDIQNVSWYQLLHWDSTREAQNKHRLITQSEQDRSCILLVRMQKRSGDFLWVHVVLQVRDGHEANQQPVIVCTNQVLSETEAQVMVTNSWLYHYYSVQSKIQFGLPFDGAARVPPTTPYYTSPHHTYPAPPHHVSYGYHSPLSITAQNSPGLLPHHNGNSPQIVNHGLGGEHYRPYAYRLESQPVDYSHAQPQQQGLVQNTLITEPKSNGSQAAPPPVIMTTVGNNNNNNHHRIGSPPAKKRATNYNRLEPLYIPEPEEASPEHQNTLVELQTPHSMISGDSNGHGQTVLITSASIARPRALTKAPPEPTDFIDQWNPSPPWSDTTQKVPDISQQELSPYITTTPPTPTSAHGSHSGSLPSFSFDWMPEQFVPIVDCVPCLTQDGISVPVAVPLQVPHWHTDHRLLTLQPPDRRSDEESSDSKDSFRRSH